MLNSNILFFLVHSHAYTSPKALFSCMHLPISYYTLFSCNDKTRVVGPSQHPTKPGFSFPDPLRPLPLTPQVLLAARNIAADEQLFDSYVDLDLPVRERRAELLRWYRFDCDCANCAAELAAVKGGGA